MGLRNEVQNTPQTLATMVEAARERGDDALALYLQDRHTSALYFFGYVVELLLKVAFFRCLGESTATPWRAPPGERSLLRRFRQQLTDLSAAGNWVAYDMEGLHALDGWAWLLMKTWRRTDSYDRHLAQQMVRRVLAVRDVWSVELRYWPGHAAAANVERVVPHIDWLEQHLTRTWSQ